MPRVVPTDPDDDHVLAAAVTGAADLIASGDKRDLLSLGSYQGIPTVTAREAVERLEAKRQDLTLGAPRDKPPLTVAKHQDRRRQ